MAADFRLKQHLKMSPNAQIKNLVPENLSEIPAEEDWKLGRIWFNNSIGKLQGVFLKLDNTTGLPVQPEEWEVRIVGADALGPTLDGSYWPDGLFDFTEQTKIADAMDDVNEALKDLAPAEATLLRGDLDLKQTTQSGRIARLAGSPDSIRMTGTVEGASIDYIITTSDVEATLPTEGIIVKGTKQQQFGRADQGIIKAVFDGVDSDEGLNLYELFNEAGRDYFGIVQGFDPEVTQTTTNVNGLEIDVEANPNKDGYRSTSGALTINTVERYNDFKKWQRGTGTVNFTVSPGRHTFHVEHDGIISGSHLNAEIETEAFKTNDTVIFYDPNTTAPTTQILDFSIAGGDAKYVSGIPFYTNNIQFSVDLRATNVFNYTYWDKPISLSATGTDAGLLEWNHADSNLNGLTIPAWNDTFNLSGHIINYTASNSTSETITLKAKAGKVATGWGTETSHTLKLLLDTNTSDNNSSPLKETFIDEQYRIKHNIVDMDSVVGVEAAIGSWNSTVSLQSGEAQQYRGSLIKAQSDYAEYGIPVDYTSFANVTQTYYRRIWADGKSNSNGELKITTNGIIGIDFEIFVKFPSVTGWLNINELFDNETFAENHSIDGTGCGTAVNKTTTGYNIPWSMGTFSTTNSGFGYVIKIVIKTNNFKIDEIEEISENWR